VILGIGNNDMLTDEDASEVVRTQAIDYVTSGTKGVLGAVPFTGSLFAEIAGSIIPNQRIDRIADLAVKLDQRIKSLEKEQITSQLNDQEFTDLVEEALRQASRSTTEDRREYLASLVANSLSSEEITHLESKHLMRILGELNDLEVLWLRFFHVPTIGGDQEFRELHKKTFEQRSAYIGCSTEKLDDHALQESYKDHLLKLGLLRRHIAKSFDGKPEFDTFTGELKVSFIEASSLGRLLLRNIGLIPKE
jgi:hypothetical protein